MYSVAKAFTAIAVIAGACVEAQQSLFKAAANSVFNPADYEFPPTGLCNITSAIAKGKNYSIPISVVDPTRMPPNQTQFIPPHGSLELNFTSESFPALSYPAFYNGDNSSLFVNCTFEEHRENNKTNYYFDDIAKPYSFIFNPGVQEYCYLYNYNNQDYTVRMVTNGNAFPADTTWDLRAGSSFEILFDAGAASAEVLPIIESQSSNLYEASSVFMSCAPTDSDKIMQPPH